MPSSENLREMVGTLMQVSADQVGPETSLKSLDTSLGGARLKLALDRLGLQVPAGFTPTTFGELEAALSVGTAGGQQARLPPARTPEVVQQLSADQLGLQVGVDVQDVRSLPAASDYWEHEFYKAMFAKIEIAYAVTQAEPRIHFAGFWCAKEALRKCDPTLRNTEMVATIVAHDDYGKPYLLLQNGTRSTRLPHALSISHTSDLATAVAVYVEAAAGGQSSVRGREGKPAHSNKLQAPPARPKASLSIVWVLIGLSGLGGFGWLVLRLL